MSTPLEHIHQKVRGDVDVGALLLTPSDRHHESRTGHRLSHIVLNHDRPVGANKDRSTLTIARRQGVGRDPGDIRAVLDDVDRRAGHAGHGGKCPGPEIRFGCLHP